MNTYRVYSAPKGEDQFFVHATSGTDAILAVRKYLSNPDNAKAYWLPNGAKTEGPHRFRPAPCNTTYSK
jgi:hypothetical protein